MPDWIRWCIIGVFPICVFVVIVAVTSTLRADRRMEQRMKQVLANRKPPE